MTIGSDEVLFNAGDYLVRRGRLDQRRGHLYVSAYTLLFPRGTPARRTIDEPETGSGQVIVA
jgi:hypothetical protein